MGSNNDVTKSAKARLTTKMLVLVWSFLEIAKAMNTMVLPAIPSKLIIRYITPSNLRKCFDRVSKSGVEFGTAEELASILNTNSHLMAYDLYPTRVVSGFKVKYNFLGLFSYSYS